MTIARTPAQQDTLDEGVRRCFRGVVTEDELQAILARFRADPDWMVLEPFDRGGERLCLKIHLPTGTPYGFPARSVTASTWRFLDFERPFTS